MNYYRRFMGDYAKKTAALSLAEHGAYTVLLDEYYSTETPLPAEHEALYRLCRAMTKGEQDAVRSVADRFFPVGSDGLRHNLRADEEIAKAQATIAKQRESGAEAARKRWLTDGSTNDGPNGSTHKSTDKLTGGLQIQPPTSNSSPNTKPKEKEQVRSPVGSRLPAGWTPSASLAAWFSDKRPDLDLGETLERFRDFWAAKAGKDGRKLDWDATFRTWARNERVRRDAPAPAVRADL